MTNALVEMGVVPAEPGDRRIYGVAVAQVINNIDNTAEGRVQLRLPWLPGYEPWARVAVLMAGMSRGSYFIPQIGDEVLVAFNHGDVREPYVVGCLWNGTDRPPALLPTDPVNKRIIRTPLGHEIEFDDAVQSITVTTTTQQRITMDPTKIEMATTGNTATVKLDTAGSVTIQAALKLELKAPTISIQAAADLDLQGGANAKLAGGGACTVQGAVVKIN